MKIKYCILLIFLVLLVKPVLSQNDSIYYRYAAKDTITEDSKLFDSNELLSISLRFDITQYKKKRSDKEYLDAILTYYKSNNDSINKSIRVRARGEFRRNFCDLPPLMLNFKSKDTVKGEFFKINKLKMVTECKTKDEEVLFKEYLTYRLYNALTENSFRVRLLKVNYINTFKNKKPESEYAFIIEPVELLTKRLNSVEVRTTNITQKKIKPEMMDRAAIFNYMIGNTDWSVPIQHNVLILSQGRSERPDLGIIVPFDFDYSGLVNASYAVPYEGLGITSVLDRRYLGICRNEDVYIKALREYLDHKIEFYRIINEFPYLNGKAKKEMIMYLDGFFAGIDKRNTIAKKMLYDCISF